MLQFSISEGNAFRRIDSFINNLLPKAPLSYRKKVIAGGHLRVNGSQVGPESVLRIGDEVSLKESAKTLAFLSATLPPIDVLYEDSWIMVLNKPGTIPMHATAEIGGDNLVDAGTSFLTLRGEEGKLRPVNRLDRGTSGAVILARNSTSAGMFGRFVKEEGLDKVYLAVVQGEMHHEGNITAPLEGKEAETGYRLVFQGAHHALVLLYPLTGRMHQIRQHLSLLGNSIIGDRRYGGAALGAYPGHALHSFRTSFLHPATGEAVTVWAPLPGPMIALIRHITGKTTDEVFDALQASMA